MFGPYGCFPHDVWTIIFSYADFSTLHVFAKVHPRFIRSAKHAYELKRKRRRDFSAISVIIFYSHYCAILTLYRLRDLRSPQLTQSLRLMFVAQPFSWFKISLDSLYGWKRAKSLPGGICWDRSLTTLTGSVSLAGKQISSLEKINQTIHKANCTELVGIAVTKGGVLAVSSCRSDTVPSYTHSFFTKT